MYKSFIVLFQVLTKKAKRYELDRFGKILYFIFNKIKQVSNEPLGHLKYLVEKYFSR